MNTRELEALLASDPIARPKFCGVYAKDTLPGPVETYPCGFIANTDPKNRPGQHWVAFYFPSQAKGEFFDSYGNPPGFYDDDFEQFLKGNCQQWTYNRRTLQSLTTAVCGEYCVYYLLHRARGVSMNAIVKRFSSSPINNDQDVYQYVMKLMRQ